MNGYKMIVLKHKRPGFLMTREIAHQTSFEKALYSIEPNFSPGQLKGDPRFSNVYFNMSQSDSAADDVGPPTPNRSPR